MENVSEKGGGSAPRVRRRSPVARIFLGAFLAMLLVGLGFGGWLYLRPGEKAAPPKPPEPRRYDIMVTRVRHNAMRDGVLAWTVDAESVGYSRINGEAKIQKVNVVFFGGGSRRVTASADEGSIDTDKRDMELSGAVTIKDDPYTFRTKKVAYRDSDRKLVADEPVNLSGKRITISGDSMDYDINTRITRVKGNVKGLFF